MKDHFSGYLIAIIGIPALMIFWAYVQRAWHGTFSEGLQDEDALACRGTCSGCTGKCANKQKGVS